MKFSLINAIISNQNYNNGNGDGKLNRTFPIGPNMLRSYLEMHGVEVDYLDYALEIDSLEELTVQSFLSKINKPAKYLGIGCMNNLLPFVLLVCEAIKQKWPYVKIVLGGPGPSGVAEALMQQYGFIDYIVKGEGEQKMLALLQAKDDFQKISTIPDLFYRAGSKVCVGAFQRKDLIANLNQLPWPKYDMVKDDNYQNMGIMLSRGCPYKCTFCDSPSFWNNSFRKRSVDDSLMEQLRYIYFYLLYEHIYIWDDTFLVNKGLYESFCEAVMESRLPITWSAYGRVDQVDKTILEKLRAGGCAHLFFGIESGSAAMLKEMKKEITLDQIEHIISVASEVLPSVSTGFIWGYPNETMHDFEQTIEMVERFTQNEKIQVRYVPLNPCPSTAIYEQQKEYLWFNEDFQPYMIKFNCNKTFNRCLSMVKENPRIFPNFWSTTTPDFEAKLERIKDMNSRLPDSVLINTY